MLLTKATREQLRNVSGEECSSIAESSAATTLYGTYENEVYMRTVQKRCKCTTINIYRTAVETRA